MAPPLGGGDRWFESSRADFSPLSLRGEENGGQDGALAELGRHPTVDRTPAQGTGGSSPPCSILEEWPSGLRRRTANPQWAVSSTASSNLASSVLIVRGVRPRGIRPCSEIRHRG